MPSIPVMLNKRYFFRLEPKRFRFFSFFSFSVVRTVITMDIWRYLKIGNAQWIHSMMLMMMNDINPISITILPRAKGQNQSHQANKRLRILLNGYAKVIAFNLVFHRQYSYMQNSPAQTKKKTIELFRNKQK